MAVFAPVSWVTNDSIIACSAVITGGIRADGIDEWWRCPCVWTVNRGFIDSQVLRPVVGEQRAQRVSVVATKRGPVSVSGWCLPVLVDVTGKTRI